MGGQTVSYPGKVTSGEFIDIIISRDYIEARIVEELQRLLIVTPKIPYTLEGFTQVESLIRSVLRQAGINGIIAPAVSSGSSRDSF